MTYMINVSDTMRMLLERMDKFPNEFVNPGRTVADYSIDDLYSDTRWDSISVVIMGSRYSSQGTVHSIFTAEEVNAYREKMGKLIRKQVDECICTELLNPLRDDGSGMQRDMFRDDLANNKLYSPYQAIPIHQDNITQTITTHDATRHLMEHIRQQSSSRMQTEMLKNTMIQDIKKLGLIDVLKKKFQNL